MACHCAREARKQPTYTCSIRYTIWSNKDTTDGASTTYGTLANDIGRHPGSRLGACQETGVTTADRGAVREGPTGPDAGEGSEYISNKIMRRWVARGRPSSAEEATATVRGPWA